MKNARQDGSRAWKLVRLAVAAAGEGRTQESFSELSSANQFELPG